MCELTCISCVTVHYFIKVIDLNHPGGVTPTFLV